MEIVGNTLLFYGHGVFNGIVTDVILAAIALVPLWYYEVFQRLNDKKMMLACGYVWLMYMPNSIYLFLEFRHILVRDGIADSLEPQAVVVFGFLSLLGALLCVIQINLAVTKIRFFRNHKNLAAILISFAAAWGGVLGLHDLTSLEGVIFPPSILRYTLQLLTVEWATLTVIVGTLFALISLVLLEVRSKELQIK